MCPDKRGVSRLEGGFSVRAYRLLLVDDEPHVIEAIISLLETQTDLLLDIYFAYSGKQAMEIMKKGKIDLLITDIQMPDMTGLELVNTVNRVWPICKIIFLTAYSDFNYAYEAIQKHAASYILKSEDDDYILHEVRKALTAIDDDLNQRQALMRSRLLTGRKARPVSRELFFHVITHSGLSRDQLQPLFSILGFTDPMSFFYLLYGLVRRCPKSYNVNTNMETSFVIQDLFHYNMSRYLSHSVCELDELGNLIWILQTDPSLLLSDPTIQLSGTLETVQSSCLTTADIDISFVLSQPIRTLEDIAAAFSDMKTAALLKSEDSPPFIFTLAKHHKVKQCHRSGHNYAPSKSTIKFIKEYIQSHIAGDVSLMQLSTATGYNSTYISDLFHKTTGVLLSRYITQKKLEMIETLLCDQKATIEKVCELSGFTSRSYFNNFIKRETGLTPKSYRMKVLSQSITK